MVKKFVSSVGRGCLPRLGSCLEFPQVVFEKYTTFSRFRVHFTPLPLFHPYSSGLFTIRGNQKHVNKDFILCYLGKCSIFLYYVLSTRGKRKEEEKRNKAEQAQRSRDGLPA